MKATVVQPRFEKKYREEAVPLMREKFGLKNVHQVPKITKVTLNMGVGKAVDNKKRLEEAVPYPILMDVVITGQNRFQLTRAITRDERYAKVPVIM